MSNEPNPIQEAPVRVHWYISADIECPYCQHENSFMDIDEWWTYCKPGENVEKFCSAVDFKCTECGKTFKVDGSDY